MEPIVDRSCTCEAIAKALATAQSQYKPVVRNQINPHFKNTYADLSALIDATKEALTSNGLAVTQIVYPNATRAIVETRLMHTSGQWLNSVIELAPAANTPQAMGSAYTYARRYSLSALLGVASEPEDDGNIASNVNEELAKQVAKKPPPAKPKPADEDPLEAALTPSIFEEIATTNLGYTLPEMWTTLKIQDWEHWPEKSRRTKAMTYLAALKNVEDWQKWMPK